MNIIFSDHARLKMQQRKLRRHDIISVIEHPDYMGGAYGKREALFKKFRKRSLKVIIVREYNQIVVVTAHWVA